MPRPRQHHNRKRYIISLGGSLIIPAEIDVKYLEKFREFLAGQVRKGQEFFIAPGGGKISRKYSEAAQVLGVKDSESLDWLGIYTIRLNRLFLELVFQKTRGIKIIEATDAHPGQSSDAHAVQFAQQTKSQTILNLSNVDYVYDKNPHKHNGAKPLENISWKDFRKIVGDKWGSNQSWPFDPVASKLAERAKLTVVFLNGKDLRNLQNFLTGKKFIGTVIS